MFNRETAFGMLRQGNNGAEILRILNAITEDESERPEPTLEEISF